MILIHIVLALASVGLAAYNLFKPAKNKLKIAYLLATGTLSTGVLLIAVNHASIIHTCISGISLFAVVSLLNEVGRYRLNKQEV